MIYASFFVILQTYLGNYGTRTNTDTRAKTVASTATFPATNATSEVA
jgi:hypothetical protein